MILDIVSLVLNVYFYILIGRILLSWIPSIADTPIGQLIYKITEPYLAPFRRIIPPIGGMLDISPILAFIAFHFLSDLVIRGLGTVMQWLGMY